MKDLVPLTQGGIAVTFPAWAPLLSSGWNVFIAIMGGTVLALTIYNKVLEIKQRRKALLDNLEAN